MSSDQDRQTEAREAVAKVLHTVDCTDNECGGEYAHGIAYPRMAAAVIANVETVIRAAGGEVRTEHGLRWDDLYYEGAYESREDAEREAAQWDGDAVLSERTVYVMPWEKVEDHASDL